LILLFLLFFVAFGNFLFLLFFIVSCKINVNCVYFIFSLFFSIFFCSQNLIFVKENWRKKNCQKYLGIFVDM
jgi:hypothetical protein